MRIALILSFFLGSFSLHAQQQGVKQISTADSLFRAGKFYEASTIYFREIEILEESDSTDSPKYIHSVASLMKSYFRTSRLKEAHELGLSKESIIKKIQQPDFLNLGEFYKTQGEITRVYSSNFSKAKNFYELALSSFSKSESELVIQRIPVTYVHLGTTHSLMANYDSAHYFFQKALEVSKKLFGTNHFRVGGIYSQIGSNNLKRSEFWEALSNSKQAITISLWEVDSTLVDPEKYMGSDSLEIFYDDFLELAEDQDILSKFHPIDAQVSILLMSAFTGLGDFNKAERIALISEQVFESSNQEFFANDSRLTLGNIYSYRSQYQYALSIYEKVKRSYRALNITQTYNNAQLYSSLARVHSDLNQVDSVKHYALKALKIREQIYSRPNFRIAESYFDLYEYFAEIGPLDSAIFFLEEASITGYHPAPLHLSKARIAWTQKDIDKAYQEAHKAIKGLSTAKTFVLVNALNLLGEISYSKNGIDSAIFYFDEAIKTSIGDKNSISTYLETNDFDNLDNPTDLFSSISAKSHFLLKYFKASKDFEALQELDELTLFGKRLVGNLRASFIIENDNLSFSKTLNEFVEICIEVNVNLYEINKEAKYLYQAFAYADMNKAQILLGAIKSSLIQKTENNSVLNEWILLKKALASERSKVKDLELAGNTSPSEISLSKIRLLGLERDYQRLLQKLKEDHPGILYYLSEELLNFPIQDFKKYLSRSNSAAIQYFMGKEKIYRFLMTGKSISYEVSSNNDSLKKSAKSLVNFMKTNETNGVQGYQEFISNSTFLNKQLLDLDKDKINDKNLIILPDGYLSEIPFEVLLTEETKLGDIDFKSLPYLLKDWNVSYAFSASVLFENVVNRKGSSTHKESFGWAPFSDGIALSQGQEDILRDNNLERLVGAAKELDPIKNEFHGRIFLSDEATETRFKQLISGANILHIATHGIVNTESPELSHLVFSKDKMDTVNDGLLHLYELYDMPLQNELTILSACNTGSGNLITGEGVMSMARGFTYAGSKSVMMSLWLANDNSTSKIIQGLYAHLANKDTKSEALRKSKLEYLEASNNLSSHPFYWAHIVSTGSNEPLVESSFLRKNLFAFLLAIGLMIILILRFKSRGKHLSKQR